MSRLVITGVREDKKIFAIKALRAIAGIGLKEAKEVVDRLPGTPYVLSGATLADRNTATDGWLIAEFRDEPLDAELLATWLPRFPGDMTVGQLRSVAQAFAAEQPPSSGHNASVSERIEEGGS